MEAYAENMPDEVAADRLASLKDAGFDKVHFAWAGADKPGIGHYYRIQGKTFFWSSSSTLSPTLRVIWRTTFTARGATAGAISRSRSNSDGRFGSDQVGRKVRAGRACIGRAVPSAVGTGCLVAGSRPSVGDRGRSGSACVVACRAGLDVTLADISPVALALARGRAAGRGVPLTTMAVDLEAEPFPAGPWDLIFSHHYLWRPLFAVFPRMLTPGGRLVVIQPTVCNLERHARGRRCPSSWRRMSSANCCRRWRSSITWRELERRGATKRWPWRLLDFGLSRRMPASEPIRQVAEPVIDPAIQQAVPGSCNLKAPSP